MSDTEKEYLCKLYKKCIDLIDICIDRHNGPWDPCHCGADQVQTLLEEELSKYKDS